MGRPRNRVVPDPCRAISKPVDYPGRSYSAAYQHLSLRPRSRPGLEYLGR